VSGPCPHSHPEPQDAAHVQHALDAARARCEAAGENWTEPRRRTYALLVSAGKPVKAYDLIQQFGAGVRATKPPTVYRSLDLLMGIGLVRKVVTLGAYVACPKATDCAAGLLVCSCCHAVEHLPDARPAAIAGAPQDYLIEQVVLEASGLCPLCR